MELVTYLAVLYQTSVFFYILRYGVVAGIVKQVCIFQNTVV
jgi:hypothetical protein